MWMNLFHWNIFSREIYYNITCSPMDPLLSMGAVSTGESNIMDSASTV